jgi:hypothetical protein
LFGHFSFARFASKTGKNKCQTRFLEENSPVQNPTGRIPVFSAKRCPWRNSLKGKGLRTTLHFVLSGLVGGGFVGGQSGRVGQTVC